MDIRPQSTSMRITISFYILFALCALLIFPLHEFGHYAVYRLLGVHLHMTLNTASPTDQSLRKPIAELAGPLLNLIVASAAAIAYAASRRPIWAAVALSTALMRLVVYVLVVGTAMITGSGLSLGNDEPIAAHLWGLPSLTFVAIFAVPLVIVVWSVTRTFQARPLIRVLHVAGFSLTTLFLGVLVGNVLDPWLFPNR